MAKQKRVSEKQADKKKPNKIKPSVVNEQDQLIFNSTGLQTTSLGGKRLPSVQLRTLAAQIGKVQGNQQLQRIIATLNQKKKPRPDQIGITHIWLQHSFTKNTIYRQNYNEASVDTQQPSIAEHNAQQTIRRIILIGQSANLRALLGVDSQEEVSIYLQELFGRRPSLIIEIQNEVLQLPGVTARDRRTRLLRYLQEAVVLDLEEHLSSIIPSSAVNIGTLNRLPAIELGRLYFLLRRNETGQILKLLHVFQEVETLHGHLTTVHEGQFEQRKREIAAERGIRRARSMRVGSIEVLANFNFLVYAFGAANAMGMDPYLLLAIFFQEGGLNAVLFRSIESFSDYGLDFAAGMIGEERRHPELRLGRLERQPEYETDEHRMRITPVRISGVRNVLYYTAISLKRTQENVISDFTSNNLPEPQGNTLFTWVWIYHNAGIGAGRNQLRHAMRDRNVETILQNRDLSKRPYYGAVRILGNIELLRSVLPR